MGFYDLPKEERSELVKKIHETIEKSINKIEITDQTKDITIPETILSYVSDEDTYIRKNAYLAMGKIYWAYDDLHKKMIQIISKMLNNENYRVRQTAVHTLGEIGKKDTADIMALFETALNDEHHSVRNAVVGSLKQMGQRNPEQTFKFAWKHIHSNDPKIRREIIHGIELRGRTHPKEVLPFLRELENEENKEVRAMIIHVLGQISYKSGCLEVVVEDLKEWKNTELVNEMVDEIINVHKRYKFAARTPVNAEEYIKTNL